MTRTLGPMRPTIECLLERLIPGHPGLGPGARDAKVIEFVEGAITHSSCEDWNCLCSGTSLVGQLALGLWGASFVDLSTQQQDDVITNVARVPHPTSRRYLRLLLNLAVAGMFGDPKHGGNWQGISWQWINHTRDDA